MGNSLGLTSIIRHGAMVCNGKAARTVRKGPGLPVSAGIESGVRPPDEIGGPTPMYTRILRPSLVLIVLSGWPLAGGRAAADPPVVPAEAPADAKRRHERVAERRAGTDIICHRGAS